MTSVYLYVMLERQRDGDEIDNFISEIELQEPEITIADATANPPEPNADSNEITRWLL